MILIKKGEILFHGEGGRGWSLHPPSLLNSPMMTYKTYLTRRVRTDIGNLYWPLQADNIFSTNQ